MVDIRGASVEYASGVHGLNGLTLHVEDGEFCFIVGASGSGKSTLSKLITGELQPDSGSVQVNGFHMERLSSRTMAEARRTIGMVFQDFRLIPSMTVEENLEFAMRCIGASNTSIYARIPEVLDLVSLVGKEDRFPSELSGGEQQRVAIARAIINHPRLIIADEPTGNLDPKLSEEILRLLLKINELGTTMLVITHARELVQKFSKRTIALSHGRIEADAWKTGAAALQGEGRRP